MMCDARLYGPQIAALSGTRVLGLTAPAAGLPYITSAASSAQTVERLCDALRAALEDPALAYAREALLLEGVQWTTLDDYRAVLQMEMDARELGYPVLS